MLSRVSQTVFMEPGPANSDEGFEAHAWLKHQGRVVLGGPARERSAPAGWQFCFGVQIGSATVLCGQVNNANISNYFSRVDPAQAIWACTASITPTSFISTPSCLPTGAAQKAIRRLSLKQDDRET